MRNLKITVWLLAFFLIMTFPIKAEEITLEDLINSTLDNNLDLQETRQELNQTESLLNQAKAGRQWRSDFMLDFSEQKTPDSVKSLYDMTEEDVDDTFSVRSESIAFSRIAIDSIKNNVEKQQVRTAYQEKNYSLQQKKLEIIEDLIDDFYNLISAQRGVELAEKVVEQRENLLEREKKKLDEEESVKRDVVEAESELADAKTSLEAALESLSLAEENLAQYTGIKDLNADEILIPDFRLENLPEKANPWPWELSKLQKIALEENPDVKKASLANNLTDIELEEAKSEKWPDITLSSSYTSADDQAVLGLELTSDYRFIGTITHFDTSLPEIEKDDIQLDEVDSGDFAGETPYEDITINDEQLADVLSSITSTATGGGGEDQWQISLNLEYNIFDSGLTNSRINEKEEEKEKAHNQQKNAEEKIKLAVHKNYNELQDSYRQIKRAETEYRQARQQFEDMKKMHENEMANEEKLELAELNMLRTKNELENTFYDYERAKTKIATILGFEIDWFIDTLSLK